MDPAGNGPSGTVPAPDGLRLLIVDDNRDAADMLSLLLGFWGHRPTVAYDADGALRAAVAAPPEAVLLDLGMPDRDGFALADELRRADGLGDIPLIALTGYADQEHRDRALVSGFHKYLVKPVENLALQAVLAQVAEMRGRSNGAANLTAEGHALAGRSRALTAEGLRRMDAIRKTLEEGPWAPGSGGEKD
jgi:CheY-like chemotaxis protein